MSANAKYVRIYTETFLPLYNIHNFIRAGGAQRPAKSMAHDPSPSSSSSPFIAAVEAFRGQKSIVTWVIEVSGFKSEVR